jgi:hypothetical protein
MDTAHFDALIRSLATSASRRGFLVALASGLPALLPLALGGNETDGKTRKAKRKHKKSRRKKRMNRPAPAPPPPPVSLTPPCTPTCAGKTCGDDGCGGSCGSCGANQACQGGSCVCTAQCCADTDCGACAACQNGACVTTSGAACGSGGTCLANRSCAVTCDSTGQGPCPGDCSCILTLDGQFQCFPNTTDPCSLTQQCSSTAECPPGQSCLGIDCPFLLGHRCAPLCTV